MVDPVLTVQLDPGSELTIVGQIRAQLTLLIADGRLKPGNHLPSVRTLANRLGVNVNTVRAAYARLERDGVVTTRHGVGTIVRPVEAGLLSAGVPRYMSNSVGVLIAGLNPFYIDLLRGIESKADEQGTLLFFIDAADSEIRATAAIRQLSARGVQGAIGVSIGGLGDADAEGLPIVYVDQPDRRGANLVFNGDRAAFDATQHLIQHGHRRIGLVTGPLEWANQREFLGGFMRAFDDRDWATEPDLLATVPDFSVASGRQGLRTLLDGADPPTAVITSGGILALGILQEARQRGIDVPADLAIIGYGDFETTQFTFPALTMVSLPTFDVGVAAMTLLQERIAHPSPAPVRLVFEGRLEVRESCGQHPWG